MTIQSHRAKTVLGILSAILIAMGGYSADTITTLVDSNQELSLKVAQLNSEVELFLAELAKGEPLTRPEGDVLVERIQRMELRIDDRVCSQAKKE